jgi:hypothetical protein
VDAHFVGGDPLLLDVYGFAAWQKNKGTLVLRNPKAEAQAYNLDIGKVFELPEGAKAGYKLKAAFADQRIKSLTAEAGKPLTVEFKPFEVLVFNAK